MLSNFYLGCAAATKLIITFLVADIKMPKKKNMSPEESFKK